MTAAATTALTFNEPTADAATLARTAARYVERIGLPAPPPVIEAGHPAGVVLRYPLPEAQAITPQGLVGLPLFEEVTP